jgi:hypothetical protein
MSSSSSPSSNSKAMMVGKYDIISLASLFTIYIFHSETSLIQKYYFPACLSQAGEILPEEESTKGNARMGIFKEVLTSPVVPFFKFFYYYRLEVTMGGSTLSVISFFHTCSTTHP